MRWEKLGRIFDPANRADWMVSHAANPVARHISGDIYRICCCGRNAQGRSQVGYFEISLSEPEVVREFSRAPFLSLGPLGAYDDAGVINACVVDYAGEEYHYFSGLSLGQTVPFYFYASVAISKDGGRTAQKLSGAPILERNAVDPYLTGSPCAW